MQRFWIFQFDRPFQLQEEEILLHSANSFLQKWATHGTMILSDVQLLFHQFLFIQTQPESVTASGCAIDTLQKELKIIFEAQQWKVVDAGIIFYKTDSGFSPLHFSQVENAIHQGIITKDTLLVDISLGGTENPNHLLLPASESWVKRYLSAKV